MSFNETLVIRMGGLGDLTILSSSLLALKKKFPYRPLVLATLKMNIPLMAGAEYLDRVIDIEELEQSKEPFFKVYDCRWGSEPPNIGPGKTTWEKYIGMDRSDIYDEILGVQSEKQFSIPVDSASLKEMKGLLRAPPGAKGSIIGIAPTSRSSLRCMPPEYVHPLADLILQTFGGQVVIFGKTEPWDKRVAGIQGVGINNLVDIISIQEMVATVSLVDLVISPDTSVYHIAAALGKKALALFGNIHPNTRTLYYPTVRSLYPGALYSAKELGNLLPCGDSFPCWDVPHACTNIEPGQIGAHCMRLLTPERIMVGLKGML